MTLWLIVFSFFCPSLVGQSETEAGRGGSMMIKQVKINLLGISHKFHFKFKKILKLIMILKVSASASSTKREDLRNTRLCTTMP